MSASHIPQQAPLPFKAIKALRDGEQQVVEIARRDPAVFAGYVMRDEQSGRRIRLAPMHRAWQQLVSDHDRLILWSHTEAGKCLASATPVLRYDGTIVRADAVRQGDELMGPDGSPRRVLSTCAGRSPMYRIVPNKGDPWECNDVHVLTLVHTTTGEVIDIGLDDYLKKSAFWKGLYKLFQSQAVDFAPNDEQRPVSPYFLGIWLGDGTKSLHSIQVTKPDAEIEQACREEAARFGLRVSVRRSDGRCPTYSIVGEYAGPSNGNGLLSAMQDLMRDGVCIPRAYLTASREVRAAVLAGLLDTDGHYDKRRRCYEIVQKSEAIADGVVFLARSLGIRASRRLKRAGVADYHRIILSGEFTHLPMRIARKVPSPRVGGKNSLRTGFRVEALGEGDYAGFTLDGDGRFLLGDFTVTHNTVQIAVARLLWEIGRNRNARCLLLSNTAKQAEKILGLVARYIETSAELRKVFPKLRPGEPWGATSITVERANSIKDPTVQAVGVHANIVGARLDLVVVDDILDWENTRSPALRQALYDWFHSSSVIGRLDARAKVAIIGNAYHDDDLLHRLAKHPAWKAFVYPVVWPDGMPRWPERWPLERVEQRRAELPAIEFARQMLCVARDDASAHFKRAWIDKALARGHGKRLERVGLARIPAGYRTYTGVDLAVQQHSKADLTVLFTIIVHPDGTREVLNIESGRWAGPEIIARIKEAHGRYQSIIIIENVGAQDYLVQMLRAETAIPIRTYTTTAAKKADPTWGVEGIGTEMDGGKWVIPNQGGVCEPEVAAWIQEMYAYTPGEHTGDRLMAALFAREGARPQPVAETGYVDLMSR